MVLKTSWFARPGPKVKYEVRGTEAEVNTHQSINKLPVSPRNKT
jgi:hypothetical protein